MGSRPIHNYFPWHLHAPTTFVERRSGVGPEQCKVEPSLFSRPCHAESNGRSHVSPVTRGRVSCSVLISAGDAWRPV